MPPARGHWASACEIDPFALPLEERLELLLKAEELLRGDPRIVRGVAESLAIRTLFGPDAPPISSTKSAIGHLLGVTPPATGASG